jgi:hypothetical protein
MLAALHPRPRITYGRRTPRRGAVGARDRPHEILGLHPPRCLGELRLADLLQAGVINHAEFEAERAALLERL